MGSIAVMGAGSWGTTFATLCVETGEDVRLWVRREEVAAVINDTHRNPDYLGDIPLTDQLLATTDHQEALADAELVVLAVPSHALRHSLEGWREDVPRDAIAVSLIKGIELSSQERASEVIRGLLDLPPGRVTVLSGPNLARECAHRLPSATVVAGTDPMVTARVQAACHTPTFRVYTNPDVVGVELGGAVKNPIAIAAGMVDGMGFGDNTKAMLVTRGLTEMTRLGVAQGGDPLTFSGLAGVGDLVATCMSPQSRNRGVGEQLGRGRDIDDIIAEMNMVAEGVRSSRAVVALAAAHGVEMPIVEHVVKVTHEHMDPKEAVGMLMGRSPKSEFHGLEGRARG